MKSAAERSPRESIGTIQLTGERLVTWSTLALLQYCLSLCENSVQWIQLWVEGPVSDAIDSTQYQLLQEWSSSIEFRQRNENKIIFCRLQKQKPAVHRTNYWLVYHRHLISLSCQHNDVSSFTELYHLFTVHIRNNTREMATKSPRPEQETKKFTRCKEIK